MNFETKFFINHFGKKVVKSLADKGITPVSAVNLPDANGDFSNGETGYCIDDNGTHRIRTYREVQALAA